MPASPELVTLEAGVEEFSRHLRSAGEVVEDVRETVSIVKNILQIPERIHKATSSLEKAAAAGGTMAKVFGKIGILKVIALPLETTLYAVSDTVKQIDLRAKALEKDLKPFVERLDDASRGLKLLEAELKLEAMAMSRLSDGIGDVNSRLDNAQIFVNSGVDAPDIKARLNALFDSIDNKADLANSALSPLNATLRDVELAAAELRALVQLPEFQALVDFQKALSDIEGSLSGLTRPLKAVYDKAGPVLDALGSVFGFILKPLEYALSAVLKATGLQSLIEKAGAFITDLLPDVTILDEIQQKLTDALNIEFTSIFETRVTAPLDALLAQLTPGAFLPSLSGAVGSGDDVYLALFTGSGGRLVPATAGNDIIIGTSSADTLNGGDGNDLLMGASGNDILNGGSGFDIVLFSGRIDDYAIISELGEDGFNTGTWRINHFPVAGATSDGSNTLIDVEQIVFQDATLRIDQIDTYIRTRSVDGSSGDHPEGTVFGTNDGQYGYFVGRTYSTVREIGPGGIKTGELLYTSNGVDWVFGGPGFETIAVGPGNDRITTVANGTISTGRGVPGDEVYGGDGNDVVLSGTDSARWDNIYGGTGEDTVIYEASSVGLSIFLARTDSYVLYRPEFFAIDIDAFGREQANPDHPQVGIIQDVENIIGSRHDDVIWGSAGNNILYGSLGNDSIRGLDGDDRLFGGDGHDVLIGDRGNDTLFGGAGSNLYVGGLGDDRFISDPGSGGTATYRATIPNWDFFPEFTTTGHVTNNLDMPGRIAVYVAASQGAGANWVSKYDAAGEFLGEDLLLGIRTIYGTDGGDVFETADGVSQTFYGMGGNDMMFARDGVSDPDDFNVGSRLFGGDGDDTLVGGGGEDSLYGGAGNDTLIVGKGGSRVFGGEGDDYVAIVGDAGIDRNVIYGGDRIADNRWDRGERKPLETDTLDLRESNYSWHISHNFANGGGTATGMFAQNRADASDHKYIQPTLGVDGVVARIPGVGGNNPGHNFELRVADANAPKPGGRGFIGQFSIIEGSQFRDIISVSDYQNVSTVRGNGGDDVLFSGQRSSDSLYGGAGDDVLGTYNYTFSGDSPQRFFNDTVQILLDGGEGDDTFVGGDAREIMQGGAGLDEVTYETGLQAVQVDLLAGLGSGGYAEGDSFAGIENVTGSVGNDTLTGDGQTNQLIGWDGDDQLNGGAGDDVLFGNAGNDLLSGGDGDDVLHGGTGADTLDGGAGIDLASFSELQAHPKGGADWLTGTPQGVVADLAAGTALIGADAKVLIGVENLIGSFADDLLRGDSGSNMLAGDDGNDTLEGAAGDDILIGGAGDDDISGGAGADWLFGGAGQNTLRGGDGADVLDYGQLDYGIVVEMAGAGSRAGLAMGLVVSQVSQNRAVWADSVMEFPDPLGAAGEMIENGTTETRYTFERRDMGTDDPSDDFLIQRDPITPDRLFRLNPVFARTPDDLAPVAYLPDGLLLPEQQFTIIQFWQEARDLFAEIEVISGTNSHDRMLGNAENTTFHGGAGADTIDGGGGIDTASYISSDSGVALNLFARTASGGDALGDVLSGIENLTGSAHADSLTGDDGANRLEGGGGDDTLAGGNGSDALIGDAGNDRLEGGDGSDTLNGGAGDDFIYGGATVADLRDVIFGGDGNDYLDGGWGNDELHGGEGNDTVLGDFGSDTLIGNAGDDLISGGAGSDLMSGGPGNDTLNGGWGYDRMNGGTGSDRFFHAGVADHASDWIQDYNAAEGDVLVFGLAGATRAQFQVNTNFTPRAGAADVEEAFIIYRPTGQIMWALVDGDAQTSINIQLATGVFDLV